MRFHTTILAGLAATAFTAGAHAATFNLASVAAGTTPTFSITSGGLTATFTSPAGNGFAVQSTGGLFSFGTGLVDNAFFGTDPLTISFSTPVSAEIVIPFAITDFFGPSSDALTATGSNAQSVTFTTSLDTDGYPEGVIVVLPTSAITSLTLTSAMGEDLPFAIGNVTVPEPMSITLLGAGLAGLAALRRRGSAAR